MDLETANGMRTASRDFTELLAGILTEHMGFKRDKLERCLFVHESNETRVVSHVDVSHLCQASDARKNLDADHEIGRDQERRSSQPTRT